jgi:hypothetical protein
LSVHPEGDIVLADVAREAANDITDALEALEVPRGAPSTSNP